jgi:RNA polymerase sigma-70 factor (ECF subfamily)
MAASTDRVGRDVEQAAADSTASRRAAFERHVLPEVDVLLRVALSMTDRRVDAEDLVQDTLLRAWRSIETFDGRHPRAWLLTVLRNAEINRHRRWRPELLDDPDATFERELRFGRSHPAAEDVVITRTFDAEIDAALAALPEGFRRVVMLVDVDGLTYAEAAGLLGIPEGTVMSRLHRSRKRIRDRLAAAGLAPRRRRR